jgi:hypothetical protein
MILFSSCRLKQVTQVLSSVQLWTLYGTDALLTNLFVNKFDVFCEVQTVIGGQGRNCSMDGWTTGNKLPVGIRFDPNVYFPCPNTRGYGKIIQRD